MRARVLAVRTDIFFRQIRMSKKKDDSMTVEWVLSLDLGEMGMLRVETTPEDSEADKAKAIEAFQATAEAAIHARVGGGSKPVRDGKTLQSGVNEFLSEVEIKPRTRIAYRRALESQAIPFFGSDTLLVDITQTRFAKYVAYLRSKDGWSNSTIEGYAVPVTAMMKWHGSRMEGIPALTTAKLMPKRTTPENQDRDAFSLEHVSAIVRNAERYIKREPAKYWVTVATAMTGCRIEELAQINLKTDFHYDVKANLYFFDLNENPDEDGKVRKSMKRLSSWRKVPIHSALVQAGFVKFLEEQINEGRNRPFVCQWEGWFDKREEYIKWAHPISKWGGRELNRLDKMGKVVRNELDLAYFHSMRHTFTNVLVNRQIHEEQRSALLGQKYGKVNAERYAKLRKNAVALSAIVEENLGELVQAIFGDDNCRTNA